MLETLKTIDPQILELNSADGSILVSNKLQGRIFAQINGTLVHNFVKELAENPSPNEFNNIGGNSLWPAPEGGDFAYNYPNNGSWTVQSGINTTPTETLKFTKNSAVIAKKISLRNRQGKEIALEFIRTIILMPETELPSDTGIKRIGYRTIDKLVPCGEYYAKDFLLSAWSLEQLPGAENIIAFGRCLGDLKNAVNDDFYGSAKSRLAFNGDTFYFQLGGEKRLQIALKKASEPVMIGSWDKSRNIAVLRSTPIQEEGTYFNIADNDQPDGPFSAADIFSIFNGSQELNFHELETIAPMLTDCSGKIIRSELHSTTLIFQGDNTALKNTLECFGILF